MNYFKVIKDNSVIDAGQFFLKWQEKNRIFLACPVEEAQFVLSHDGNTVYRVPWLNPAPPEAGEHETIEAAIIDYQEYMDLRAVLDDGETVPVPEPIVPEPAPEPEPEIDIPTQEQPMSVAQMRARIKEQQAEIETLTECLLEMSMIVYG